MTFCWSHPQCLIWTLCRSDREEIRTLVWFYGIFYPGEAIFFPSLFFYISKLQPLVLTKRWKTIPMNVCLER